MPPQNRSMECFRPSGATLGKGVLKKIKIRMHMNFVDDLYGLGQSLVQACDHQRRGKR